MANETLSHSPLDASLLRSLQCDLSCAQTMLSQLGELFLAIKDKASSNSPAALISIAELAGLGQYVAQDWANSIDLQLETTEEVISSERGVSV